jgi:hypothetical protein
MFEKILEFKNAIIFRYGKQKCIVLQQIVPKAEAWAITKIIIFTLNLVVLTCAMNLSMGHWLLLNALTTIITLITNMEVALLHLSTGFEIFNLIQVEILVLHMNMQLEVIKVIKFFNKSFLGLLMHGRVTT